MSAGGILIRFGEVFLKKGRQQYFLDQLAAGVQRAIRQQDQALKLTRPFGRFLVVPEDPDGRIEDAVAVARAMANVFGVVSAGPCEIVPEPEPEQVSQACVDYAKAHRRRRHKSFKIETRRANKRFPLTSIQCNQRFGSAVYEALGDIAVDVHEPDFTIGVEIRDRHAFIYGASEDGVGGLPVGSNGNALLLLSGGIDSPVAGWLTQKRGVSVDAVTFLSPPYTGPQAREKTIALARILAVQQKKMSLWVVPLTRLQERYRDEAPHEQLVLLYRRSMIRMADLLADVHGQQGLVTGESLGQVASQTLPNLHCIGSAARRPVIRPLITYDKHEAISVAERIGTYETSILPYDDCCSLFVPQHPELRGDPAILEAIEAEIQPGELEAELVAAAELITIK